jgi:RNA polymerase sigma factor (sigma-70 family)
MDLESSIELIQRAQTGDDQALDRLIARYRPRLRRWAAGRLPRFAREMADTEDLVQEALVGTIQNFRDFELRGEWALQGYLRQAVTNRIRDELRRHSRRPARDELADLPANECSPLEAAIGRQQFERYQHGLETLGPIERECVVARLELSLSYSEIAALINKPSPDAARMTVTRALAQLAKHMAS